MGMKGLVLKAGAAIAFGMFSLQAGAASIGYYLDQSNVLPDGVNYAQVTISDSMTVVGDIDFTVEVNSAAFSDLGDNFGMQSFYFNSAVTLDPNTNITGINPVWSVSENKNAGGGFGKFEIKLGGVGSERTEILTFSITGVDGDTINDYAIGSSLNPSSGEFFAAHIADFNVSDPGAPQSGQFAGNTVVPVPAAVWLFGSGLLGLVGVARRKRA